MSIPEHSRLLRAKLPVHIQVKILQRLLPCQGHHTGHSPIMPTVVTYDDDNPFASMPTVITFDDDNPLVPILLNEDDHWGVTAHSNALFEPITRQETGEFSLEFHNLSNSGQRQEDGELNLVVEFHSPQVPSYFWIQHTWFPPADPEHLLGIWFIGSSHVYSRRVKGSDKIFDSFEYSAPLQWKAS